ncbi:hypothetical protein [Streptomyces sp. NPDC101393]|uniref:hypothetical protein n=1 Tax=Streptomyces sp. NPDC101393 TaxID=3366141 RepID=UPI0037F57B81
MPEHETYKDVDGDLWTTTGEVCDYDGTPMLRWEDDTGEGRSKKWVELRFGPLTHA